MNDLDIQQMRQQLKSHRLNNIKKLIDERGLSQKWVAAKLKKSTNTLNGWCSNKVQPHLVDLCLLSLILDCDVKDLIGEINVNQLLKDN